MADHSALRDSLWTALAAEERPVTRERALAAARRVLGPYPVEAQQFAQWFSKHGDRLLEKING